MKLRGDKVSTQEHKKIQGIVMLAIYQSEARKGCGLKSSRLASMNYLFQIPFIPHKPETVIMDQFLDPETDLGYGVHNNNRYISEPKKLYKL